MSLLEVIKYTNNNENLVFRYPVEDFNSISQLIVQQSQEAIVYLGGQWSEPFKEGKYNLKTKNIPFLSSLINLPFGHKSPFSAVVYFINKTEQMNVKWGVDEVKFQDNKYNAIINVGASGFFSFKVEDSKTLMSK